jgi:hypothetical protein
MSNYFVIRTSDGAIVDSHIWDANATVTLPPMYSASEYIYVKYPSNGAGVNNGWTYKDGEFVAPIPVPVPLPVLPTISSLQAQMQAIQAQLSTIAQTQ